MGNQQTELTQQMIDQNLEYIRQQYGQAPEQNGQNNVKMAKMQEELLMKTNLDYENRLRGHMYQFDDP
jgi:FKBP-type peptidyl-prolyl cis-trans isomerase (trigger factor)